jgi:hypothetical protein
MNARYTFVIVVIFVALAVFAYSQRNAAPMDVTKGPSTPTPGVLVTVDASALEEVKVVGASGHYTLTRSAGVWQIDGAKADDTVDSVISELANLQIVGEVPADKAKPADYGFATPALTVTLMTAAGESRVFMVGDPVPGGGWVYVRVKDDPRIVWILDSQATQLKDWIDKRPLAPTETPMAGTGTPVLGPAGAATAPAAGGIQWPGAGTAPAGTEGGVTPSAPPPATALPAATVAPPATSGPQATVVPAATAKPSGG